MSNRSRPRLLRSSATEPSITVSNATGNSFAGPESPHRATDLLNRVAVYSPSPEQASTPAAIPRHTGPMSICRDHREDSPSSSPGSQSAVMADSPSGMPHSIISASTQTNINKGYYFSFPSFEEWNTDVQDDLSKCSDD
ncbi:heterogeneous nuclear ribonucleo g [Fusarium longipes]|uniref:Heterogeneous nuclear ribonucleo g n=1 Tax=Fusarium longipes TaxID=694270 RepID=A0A395SHS7_9HYPO|nr:heterogeneous nuclear ribonucleo g [Fusarium longipes]